MGIVKRFAGAGILAAAGAYFLDPDKGADRRAMIQEKLSGLMGGGAGDAKSAVTSAASQASERAREAVQQVKGDGETENGSESGAQAEEPPNDADLTDRVESEAFRAAAVPKGSINVNAEMGIVYFRGEIEDDEKRKALIAAAKEIEGVRAVEDLLHAPGEPAEAKEETEEETRRRVEENPVRAESSSSNDGG